jgi:hypothetical protein
MLFTTPLIYFYGSFNDVISSSDNTVSDSRMIGEHSTGRDVEGSGRGLI